ncbi:MAG: class I SAM-dependent methyltransferase [Chloroflexi bacterium]|nr:class I SAM-dependent methyltransferase [Chloroflexota bacterium]
MAAPESASQRHDRMVREEMLQAERVRSTAGKPADFWQTLARNFRAPAPGVDPTPEALAALIEPGHRVIDVGAGGGRIAIPLARRCRELVAVEPSPAMRAVLAEEMARHGVTNIRVVPTTWEEAEVEPAELVFAAHVTYGIQVIEPFLRKLDAKATRHAALVAMADPPQIAIAPFWRAVHGEERLRLPCRAELLDVLRELGAQPEVIPLAPMLPNPFGTRQETIDLLRFRLLAGPGTPADERLLACLDELAVERDGLLWPKDARPNERAILRWEPGRLR